MSLPNRNEGAKILPFPTPPGKKPATPTKPPRPMSLVERIVFLKKWAGPVRRAVDWTVPDWVTPNMITWFRAALIVPIVWALNDGRYWTASAVFGIATFLDFVDGALAEIRLMNSAGGAFLDPLADKVLICGTLLALGEVLPAWINLAVYGTVFFAAAITFIRIVKLAALKRRGETPTAETVAAKPAGKLKMICEVVAVLLLIVGIALAAPGLMTIGGAILAVGCGLAALSFLGQFAG